MIPPEIEQRSGKLATRLGSVSAVSRLPLCPFLRILPMGESNVPPHSEVCEYCIILSFPYVF